MESLKKILFSNSCDRIRENYPLSDCESLQYLYFYEHSYVYLYKHFYIYFYFCCIVVLVSRTFHVTLLHFYPIGYLIIQTREELGKVWKSLILVSFVSLLRIKHANYNTHKNPSELSSMSRINSGFFENK